MSASHTMDNHQMNHTFFSETVRTMYNLFGYEALMKEVLYIHHLHQAHHPAPASAPILSPTPAPIPSPVPVSSPHSPPTLVHCKRPAIQTSQGQSAAIMVNKVMEVKEDDGAEVAEEKNAQPIIRAKYSRSKKPEEDRCQHLTNKGTRCTLVRYGTSIFCSRHTRVTKIQEEVDEKKEEESEEDSTPSFDSE